MCVRVRGSKMAKWHTEHQPLLLLLLLELAPFTRGHHLIGLLRGALPEPRLQPRFGAEPTIAAAVPRGRAALNQPNHLLDGRRGLPFFLGSGSPSIGLLFCTVGNAWYGRVRVRGGGVVNASG